MDLVQLETSSGGDGVDEMEGRKPRERRKSWKNAAKVGHVRGVSTTRSYGRKRKQPIHRRSVFLSAED